MKRNRDRVLTIKHSFSYILLLAILGSCGVSKSLKAIPDVSAYRMDLSERTKISNTSFVLGKNHLHKNKYGLWELYVKGNPLEIGTATGSLTRELFHKQEEALLTKVAEIVPSPPKQYFLRKFLKWYNRKLYLNIKEEYKTEIYGLSQYASDTYNYIAEPYARVLYLHGAHDIGHALQDLAVVGCTSFAVWGNKTEDGQLLLGRNFDFYAGDDFSEEKIIAFVNPEEGYKFMSVTWGGMIGVVSGMNEQGLTVTINAGKSKVPLAAKTPISLLTREILQYAATLEEAVEIAKSRQVFVSESIMVGSARDKKAVIIEVSPDNFGVYEVPNSDQLICANHFQSDAYLDDVRNQEHIIESHSLYRYERMEELLDETTKVTPTGAVAILRNKEGLQDEAIGYGNEKALNQLLAHHSVVFKPEELLVWVSSNPYQLGAYVGYDLKKIFSGSVEYSPDISLATQSMTIAEDPFQYTRAYKAYQQYRKLRSAVLEAIHTNDQVPPGVLQELQNSNPEYWQAYYITGKYYYEKKYLTAALQAFEIAQTKEITTQTDKENIVRYIKKIQRKLHL